MLFRSVIVFVNNTKTLRNERSSWFVEGVCVFLELTKNESLETNLNKHKRKLRKEKDLELVNKF